MVQEVAFSASKISRTKNHNNPKAYYFSTNFFLRSFSNYHFLFNKNRDFFSSFFLRLVLVSQQPAIHVTAYNQH